MRRIASTIFLLLLTSTLIIGCSFVKAQETLPILQSPIYILNDGSISPTTAPIQRNGNTYILTGNVNNTIDVQCSNVIINGNGFTMTNPVNATGLLTPVGYLPGIEVSGVSNVTVTNTAFANCITGITIQNSTSITINRNTIQQTLTGIAVLSSSNLNIDANEILLSNNQGATGMTFLPTNPQSFTPFQINIEGNQITGSSSQAPTVAFLQPSQYGIWGGFDSSTVILNTVGNLEGIAFYYTGSNNVIANNNFQHSYEGIFFTGDANLSVNNTFYENNFFQNSANAVVPWISGPPPGNNWDNGTVGNYWSDYNGTELDNSGLGSTPYIIQTVYMNYTLNRNETVWEGQDNYPLISPVDITIGPVGVIDVRGSSTSTDSSTSTTATPSPTFSQAPPSSPSAIPELQLIPVLLFLIITAAALAVFARRKRLQV